MPSRNVIKHYLPDSFYHVYNRGVEKRPIYIDDQDLVVFRSYLSTAANMHNVKICEFAYKPNHFHVLIFQKGSRDMQKMMHSVGTRYTIYFNVRYDRVGRLFQGTYKARLVNSDEDYTTVVSYIRNHIESDADSEVKPGLTLW